MVVPRLKNAIGSHSNLINASAAMVAGRALGLGWTVALSLRLGVGSYGLYAMAFSASALVAGILDGPPTIRGPRLNDFEFHGDQRIRALIGLPLLLLGLVIARAESYVIGFGLVFAAGELLLGIYKSGARRSGDAQSEQLMDLARQGASVLIGTLLLFSTPLGITGVSYGYALPYLAIGVPLAAGAILRSAASKIAVREWLTLSGTGVVAAGYVQLDVILVGVLVGHTAAGTYAIASLIAWALAVPSQQFATRKIPHLRKRVILPAELAEAWHLSLLSGFGALALGIGGLVTGVGPNELGDCLLLMAPFVATRGLNWAMNVALPFVDSDAQRLAASVLGLAVDVVAIAILATALAAVGAAVASSLADLVLLVAYVHIVRARLPRAFLVGYAGLAVLAVLGALWS